MDKIALKMKKIVGKYQGVSNLVVLLTFLFVGFFVNLFYKGPDVLQRERRKPAERPGFFKENQKKKFTWNEKFSGEFEAYALDNFYMRENLQDVKGYASFYALRQKDYHGIFMIDGKAWEKRQLNRVSIEKAGKKINAIQRRMPENMNCYYAVIPEKGYYLEKESGVPSVDYGYVKDTLKENLPHMKYVNLFSELSADSYFNTDLHWRQEKLNHVVEKMSEYMGFESIDFNGLEYEILEPFRGNYYGKTSVPLKAEALLYLNDNKMKKNKVEYLNPKTMKMEEGSMYEESLFYLRDPYDIYLKGTQPVITIENDSISTEKELYLFRDSFGSSLAPLLSLSYKKITLIDLRYISDSYVNEWIEFKEQADVLFLYSMEILNDSSLLLVKLEE